MHLNIWSSNSFKLLKVVSKLQEISRQIYLKNCGILMLLNLYSVLLFVCNEKWEMAQLSLRLLQINQGSLEKTSFRDLVQNRHCLFLSQLTEINCLFSEEYLRNCLLHSLNNCINLNKHPTILDKNLYPQSSIKNIGFNRKLLLDTNSVAFLPCRYYMQRFQPSRNLRTDMWRYGSECVKGSTKNSCVKLDIAVITYELYLSEII